MSSVIGVDLGGTKVALALLRDSVLGESQLKPTDLSSASALIDQPAPAKVARSSCSEQRLGEAMSLGTESEKQITCRVAPGVVARCSVARYCVRCSGSNPW